jgi:hypothetical protein
VPEHLLQRLQPAVLRARRACAPVVLRGAAAAAAGARELARPPAAAAAAAAGRAQAGAIGAPPGLTSGHCFWTASTRTRLALILRGLVTLPHCTLSEPMQQHVSATGASRPFRRPMSSA